MKILIVSYFFPPFNSVGALRVGKTAKYLSQEGHEVKVLTADRQPLFANLPVEIDEPSIIRTSWFDVNKPVQLLLGGKKSVAEKGYERAGSMPSLLRKLGYWYKDIFNFPDGQIGWYPYALRCGKALLKTWQPDFILASCPPMTSFLVARALAKYAKVPWVADFRDLWADNYNSELYQSRFRRWLDKKIERKVVDTAAGLIIVSEPLAETLRTRLAFKGLIQVITNGYDLADYPPRFSQEAASSNVLRIVYTGTIYPVKKDPSPLFKALILLGEEARKIQVDFYGRNNELIKKLAQDSGVGHLVHCHGVISYYDSLKEQVNADLLLLLTYNSIQEKGVVTAKFFEYLGAKRPILFTGCLDGVPAHIIRERGLGFVENDPEKIAAFLKKCLHDKEQGLVKSLSLEDIKGFSRLEKTRELISFLTVLKNR